MALRGHEAWKKSAWDLVSPVIMIIKWIFASSPLPPLSCLLLGGGRGYRSVIPLLPLHPPSGESVYVTTLGVHPLMSLQLVKIAYTLGLNRQWTSKDSTPTDSGKNKPDGSEWKAKS